MNKRIAAILFGVAFAGSFQSHGQHINGWLRTTGSLRLTDKWKTDMELQGRWQNGLNNFNPLKEKLLFSYRHWVYYKHDESLQFGLSPFAYYSLFKIIEDSTDYNSSPVHEYRSTVSAEVRHRLIGNLYATDKTMLEYRIFGHSGNILRLRNKLGLEYKINKPLAMKLSHEVLLNAAGVEKQHFFDHERTSASLEIKTAIGYVEAGYIHASRLPVLAETTLTENNLFINLGFTINQNRQVISNVRNH